MANLNKVMLIGRLTRDPEIHTFPNGGRVARFGFAVNNRKKNMTTGQWEEVPVFLDVKAFNRETGRKLADTVEQYFRKGGQFYLEGHLLMEEWEDKNGGGKRSKLTIILDDFQFFDSRQDGGGEGRSMRSAAPPTRQPQPVSNYGSDYNAEGDVESAPAPAGGDDIPF
jgi:single-strand DNA-binding protein